MAPSHPALDPPTRGENQRPFVWVQPPCARTHVWVLRTQPAAGGGRWLRWVWPGTVLPHRGGSPIRALPTSPQI